MIILDHIVPSSKFSQPIVDMGVNIFYGILNGKSCEGGKRVPRRFKKKKKTKKTTFKQSGAHFYTF